MSFPSKSHYFADRAAEARRDRDRAADPAIAYAHGEVADRYQVASDKAKIAEDRGMSNDATHHDGRESEQRELAGTAVNNTTRDFHNDTADRHAGQASSIRKAAKLTGGAIHDRLVNEAAVENLRNAAALLEHEERYPRRSTFAGPVSDKQS